MELPIVAWAVMYEEAARSLFGPLAFNCMAPDDGNMNLLRLVGTPAQKDKWLRPIVDGKVRSSFAMTEPAPGGGSDPSMIRTRAEKKGDKYVIYGRKWFITGADGAAHFILVARTSDDQARAASPRSSITRTSPAGASCAASRSSGPEEHGGHCELEFDGLEVAGRERADAASGDGLKVTQMRLGPARLTHCMRWLGWAKRCMEIAQDYVKNREGFGIKLADRESVQIKLGEVAHQIQIGRLLTMHAAWKLDQGDRARKEVSMAKVHVADTLHQAADVAIQLQGARGYLQGHHRRMDLPRRARGAPRRRRLRGAQDGAGELHARGRPRLLAVGPGRGAKERALGRTMRASQARVSSRPAARSSKDSAGSASAGASPDVPTPVVGKLAPEKQTPSMALRAVRATATKIQDHDNGGSKDRLGSVQRHGRHCRRAEGVVRIRSNVCRRRRLEESESRAPSAANRAHQNRRATRRRECLRRGYRLRHWKTVPGHLRHGQRHLGRRTQLAAELHRHWALEKRCGDSSPPLFRGRDKQSRRVLRRLVHFDTLPSGS